MNLIRVYGTDGQRPNLIKLSYVAELKNAGSNLSHRFKVKGPLRMDLNRR